MGHFTASHYIEVAAIIRAQRELARTDSEQFYNVSLGRVFACDDVQEKLASMFSRDNPRFDRDRFNDNCRPAEVRA